MDYTQIVLSLYLPVYQSRLFRVERFRPFDFRRAGGLYGSLRRFRPLARRRRRIGGALARYGLRGRQHRPREKDKLTHGRVHRRIQRLFYHRVCVFLRWRRRLSFYALYRACGTLGCNGRIIFRLRIVGAAHSSEIYLLRSGISKK